MLPRSRLAELSIVVTALLLGASWATAGLTPEQKCQAGKNQAAGKYAACRQNAEAKFAKNGDPTKYAKDLAGCTAKFTARWQKLEASAAKAGATCRDGTSTAGAFQAVIDAETGIVAAGLAGGGLPECPIALADCQSDLAACEAAGGTLLETGQTTCYDAAGMPLPSCAGTGQDGELQKGLARSYTDNGDGTIKDNRTGLTWEKLGDDDSLHDLDLTYTWEEAFGKITLLNTPPCFATHCDWRLPNVNELHSIVDYVNASPPKVHAVFDTGCTPACAVTGCSCTASAPYWSSTTYSEDPGNAWVVFFDFAYSVVIGIDVKGNGNYVRAVRGGS